MTNLDQPPRRLKDAGDAIGIAGEFFGPDTSRLANPARHRARMRVSPERAIDTASQLYARAVCDVYDEMTSNPLDQDGLELAHAVVRMAELTRQGQFDPRAFLAFVACMGIYPVGSLVRLRSGRIGLVTEQSGNVPYAPRVKVFYATGVARPILVETVDLSQADCRDDIVARESNAEWKFRCLDPLLVGGSSHPQRIERRGLHVHAF